MELKPLAEVDLREAIGPINRAVTGHYLPLVRTASLLRERAAAGVLDLRLSRCAFLGRQLVGACLVDRVDEIAHIDAIGVDPLAQQRGVGYALLEAACMAAEAGGVGRITAEVPEGDAALMATLGAAGFLPQRALGRWAMSGAMNAVPLVEESAALTDEELTLAPPYVRGLPVAEALARWREQPEAATAPFGMRPQVLERLAGRLRALALVGRGAESGDAKQVLAVALLEKTQEKERHQIHALCGETAALTSLVAVLVARHGAQFLDALPMAAEGTAAGGAEEPSSVQHSEAALRAVGLLRTSVRSEVVRVFARG